MVVGFCLGGVVLSIGLAALEYGHARHEAATAASQQVTTVAQQLTEVLRPLIADDRRQSAQYVLELFAQDPRLAAIRLECPGQPSIVAGRWPDDLTRAATWKLGPQTAGAIGNLDLGRLTVLTVPFGAPEHPHQLRLVIDGPRLAEQARGATAQNVATAWLLLGVLTLAGLLLLRRWFINPLLRINRLAAENATPEQFHATADELIGEFGDLGRAIGHMLDRLDEMTEKLRRREKAFEHLYQFAPAAMISIDARGKVVEANRQAADLFGLSDETAMQGVSVLDYVHPKDRTAFRQSVDRLQLDQVTRCQMQLSIAGRARDVDMQFAGVYGPDHTLEQVRVSLVDVSETRQLIRQVTEQRHLLDLVIDHMSDGILLLRPDRRVITANARLCQLLNVHPDAVIDQPYEPAEFWASLDVLDGETFDRRMRSACAQIDRPCQEQFETRSGTFRFQAIAVHDADGQALAQLWVVQDVTPEVRNRRLLDQQDLQLRALRRMGEQVHQAGDVEQLLEQAVLELHRMMGVEVVGIAIRHADDGRRGQQLIHDGAKQTLLGTGQKLAHAVQTKLMPTVLSQRSTNLWTDLSQDEHLGAMYQAGIEAVAATTLTSHDRSQGIVWIGRRGGERIERYQLYLLEALAPMLSTALQNATLREQMAQLALADPLTGLPSFSQFENLTAPICRRGRPWSLLMIDLDRFDELNHRLGLSAANAALNQVAQTLRDCCRATDRPIRHTADRFVFICPDTPAADAAGLAQRIRRRIEAMALTAAPDEGPAALTCCIGVASAPDDGAQPQALVDLAEARVKRAKAAGRNRVCIADTPAHAAG